jgi:tetratricopeptide (TPR) repeat protein
MLAIVAAVVVVYANTLHAPFQYDDVPGIVENAALRDLSAPGAVLWQPANSSPAAGRPLLALVLAIDYARSGLDVTGYHVTNIVLHVVCALLLFLLVRETLMLLARKPEGGRLPEAATAPLRTDGLRIAAPSTPWWNGGGLLETHATLISAAIALLWAVHPLQTGTVTYISGRSESLMSACYLASMLAAARAHRSSSRAWNGIAIAACLLGMAAKESMVTAPLAILLYDRAFVFSGFREAIARRRALYGCLAATWVALGVMVWHAARSDSAGFDAGVSMTTYLLNQAIVIPRYLRLTIWPDYLLFAYGEVHRLRFADIGPMVVVVPLLIAASAWAWHRRAALGFPMVWVWLTLAPTSSLVPIATEAGAARRMYLPLAGIAVLVVVGAAALTARLRDRGVRLAPAGAALALAVVVVALGAVTMSQNTEYQSAETLWRGAIAHWPSALAHRNLATALKAAGARDEVVEELRAAAATEPQVRYTLGIELLEQQRYGDAIAELRRAIAEFPDDATIAIEGRRALALALAAAGARVEAVKAYEDLLVRAPNDLRAVLGYGDALLGNGQFAEALTQYRRVAAAQPLLLGAQTNAGMALMQLGRPAEALPYFRNVTTRQPGDAAAALNLSTALFATGQLAEAADAACRSLTLSPGNGLAEELLAEVRRSAAARRIGVPACEAMDASAHSGSRQR